MAIDLKNMTRKELEKLAKDVNKALEKLKKQDLKKVRQEMEKLAAAHGVSLEDVMAGKPGPKAGRKKPKSSGTKSPAKYANPADASQTWTGKGRQPEWFKTAMANGTAPEAMEI